VQLLRPVDPDRDHIRGRVDAPLTLVEYADFECPFCSKATGSIAELRKRLGGDELRYVYRHLPLEHVHPHARAAALASEAAATQGRFWEMADQMFGHADALEVDDLRAYAAAIGLDLDYFEEDLRTMRHENRVDDDAIDAEASEVHGTPTFYVNGRRHQGPYDAGTLAAALQNTRSAPE
jgi:protein-disulfide isomerase